MKICESDIRYQENCPCCGGEMQVIVELPRFPLTGIYVPSTEVEFPVQFDQRLIICSSCGHMALFNALPPTMLYGPQNVYRTSASHISNDASEVFINFVRRVSSDRRFRCVLEIGCNDLYLLKKFESMSERRVGIDPMWSHAEPPETDILVLGEYLENIDYREALPDAPDLIISTHNLEHIYDPLAELRRLVDVAANDAFFVMEVPDADSMIRNLRFDQVYHEHYHNFSLPSFLALIDELGCRYIDHTRNYMNWGGTLLVAFGKSEGAHREVSPPIVDPIRADNVITLYNLFRQRMDSLSYMLGHYGQPIWGYGAGQMLPMLAYHLDSDLDFLEGLIDDNPDRAGLYYPHLKPKIFSSDDVPSLAESTILITAQDAARPILRNLDTINPRRIICPLNAF